MRQVASCFVAVIVLAILSHAGFAQDVTSIGKIYGSIGDQDQKWVPIRINGIGSTSTYNEVVPGLIGYSIQGHIDGVFNLENSVAVSFNIMANGSIQEPKVVFLETGSIREFFESGMDSIELRLTTIEKNDNGMVRVSGEVEGILYQTKIEGISVNVDKTNALDAFLYFETDVYPEE